LPSNDFIERFVSVRFSRGVDSSTFIDEFKLRTNYQRVVSGFEQNYITGNQQQLLVRSIFSCPLPLFIQEL
jgi:hypothetical protein